MERDYTQDKTMNLQKKSTVEGGRKHLGGEETQGPKKKSVPEYHEEKKFSIHMSYSTHFVSSW